MSGGLRERLLRLRPQSPAAASTGSAAAAEAYVSGRQAGAETYESGRQAEAEALHPAFIRLGVTEETNAHGSFLLRKIEYPLHFRHGRYALGELQAKARYLAPVSDRQNKQNEAVLHGPIEPERLLFLDTETTGLGIGAGNVPFMIGIGWIEPDSGRFVVEQTLIRHPGEERAMLAYLAGRMANRTHLATYNGRTFDWPVLVNRFILNGWRRTGPEPGHLDFLHPSRALWRNTLESCRLSRIEEEKLEIDRGEDVPGSLAPALYMQFLNDGDADGLQGVYRHNERDVLTLATLAVHFGALLADGEEEGADDFEAPAGAEELYRTAAWLETHGAAKKSARLYALLAASEEPQTARWWLPVAAHYKRLGRFDLAVPLWRRTAERAERAAIPSYDAHIELAMHYEHRLKDYGGALELAERALDLALRRPPAAGGAARSRQEREELQRRIERLRRKSGLNRG
ncbi:ribonuclease H-like domain-containing protein [Cohnella massiliensis]|uniref:ribonuclease H-like domain-containing protein n=1 Tax=Cohnella massiliensis TaxID=1816691 RepID=UPI0015947146|nr:ribonuclease H-like domain-containing protein [Cohnella massiliensis]